MRLMQTKNFYRTIISIVILVILQLVFTLIAFGEENSILPKVPTPKKLTGIITVDLTSDWSTAQTVKSGFIVKLSGTDLTATTDSRGYFEINNVANNTGYTINVSKQGFLAREIKTTAEQSSTQIGPIEMWPGDLPSKEPQDNSINMIDIIEMAKSFNASSESPNYSTYKDFNQDKAINMIDILIIAKHFNTTSTDYPAIAPSIISKIETTSQHSISITFSKAIQLDSEDINDKSHYTLKNDDGKAITIRDATFSAADNTVILTLNENLYGKYTINIFGLKDPSAKIIPPVLNAITFHDMTAPTVENVYYSDAAKNKILVIFNEEMQTEGPYSVLLPTNYKWDSDTTNGTSYELLPEGSTIEVSPIDNKAVLITLGQGREVTPDSILQFGYIQDSVIKALADKEGNILNIGKTLKVELESQPTIAFQYLSITSGNSIRVKLAGSKLIKVSPMDFKYTLTGDSIDYVTPLSAKLVDIENMQYVEFTVPNDTFTVYTVLSKVMLKTVENPQGTISIFGKTISEGVTSAFASNSSQRPSIKSISIYDYNNVVVKLDGNINSSELTNFILSVQLFQGIDQIEIATASLIGSTTCSNTIMLTTTDQVDILGSVTLKTLPLTFIVATDFNGQFFKENTMGVIGYPVFMAGKLSTNVEPGQVFKNGDFITIDLGQVPKYVTTAKVEPVISGKANITIEGVGTITGLISNGKTANVEVTTKLKQIIVTFKSDTDLSYVSNSIRFIPDSAFVNTADAPIDVEVTPSL